MIKDFPATIFNNTTDCLSKQSVKIFDLGNFQMLKKFPKLKRTLDCI